MNEFILLRLIYILSIIVMIFFIIFSTKRNSVSFILIATGFISVNGLLLGPMIGMPFDNKYINVEYTINKEDIKEINFNENKMTIKAKDSKSKGNIFFEQNIEYDGEIKYDFSENNNYIITAKTPIYKYISDYFSDNSFDDIEKEERKKELKDIEFLIDITIYEPTN